jgi:hypothetical protein
MGRRPVAVVIIYVHKYELSMNTMHGVTGCLHCRLLKTKIQDASQFMKLTCRNRASYIYIYRTATLRYHPDVAFYIFFQQI